MTNNFKKPEIKDYGITENEYSLFKKSEDIRAKKNKYDCVTYLTIFIFLGLLGILVASFSGTLLVYILTNNDIVFSFFINNIIDKIGTGSLIGSIIGFSIGFSIWGYIDYKFILKKIDKEADKLLECFTSKQIEMLEQYDSDYSMFLVNINAIKKENENLLKMSSYYKNIISDIENDSIFFDTQQLKNIIEEIKNVTFKKIESTNDCFVFKSQLFKFVGVDSLLSKVDIDKIMSLLKTFSLTNATIYITENYDKNLIISDKIDVKDGPQIMELYKEYNEKKLKFCLDTIEDNNKILNNQEYSIEDK